MLIKEENGVQWYTVSDGSTVEHTFRFNGRSLTGCWVGPSHLFRVLVEMTPEERNLQITTDEYISFISRRIHGIPELARYVVEFENTALGPGHYGTCQVEAVGLSLVTEAFYKRHRAFCKITKIKEK